MLAAIYSHPKWIILNFFSFCIFFIVKKEEKTHTHTSTQNTQKKERIGSSSTNLQQYVYVHFHFHFLKFERISWVDEQEQINC